MGSSPEGGDPKLSAWPSSHCLSPLSEAQGRSWGVWEEEQVSTQKRHWEPPTLVSGEGW